MNFLVLLSYWYTNLFYLDKIVHKDIANDAKDSPFAKFGEQLKQFHSAFVDKPIVDVDNNIDCILASIKSIGDNVNEVNKNIKEHSKW